MSPSHLCVTFIHTVHFHWWMSLSVTLICKEISQLSLQFKIKTLQILHFLYIRLRFGGCTVNNTKIQHFLGATSIIIMPNIHQECTDVYPPVSFFLQKMSTSFHWCISHSRECIKIPFDKMWSLILWGWPSQHLLNQVSITFLMSSPPCHYVPQHSAPSHQTPAGFKGPTIISCLMQKHVKTWQKLRSKSHFMRSLRTFVHDRSEKNMPEW